MDISAVAGLTNLRALFLNDNSISDLSILVANTGLGSGDEINVERNPLSSPSINTHIPILQSRGVKVWFNNRTPTTLLKISGDNQPGAPGAALANPFVVEVTDQHSEVFEGVPVTFTVTEGGGVLSTQTTKTDADGRAETTLTLASKPGPNTVSVSVEGISDPVTFNTGTGVNIPDANLRAKIETALNKQSGAPIIVEEMETLTNLIAVNINISDLTGIEHATNLTVLNLQSNSLSDISPIAGLTNLTVLNLQSNSLSDISPIAGLTNLTSIDLRSNSLSDISPIAGLTNLTVLLLSDNSISDISAVTDLTNLTRLRLKLNSISDLLPLVTNSGLSSGDEIDVRGNPLNYPSITTHIPTLQSRGVTVEFDTRTPTTLEIVSGNNQQGVPDAVLVNPFVVEVRDGNNLAFEGVPVTFTVTAGGGTLSATNTVTNANGRAENRLTLGSKPGPNTVRASVKGISQTVTFNATAGAVVNIPDTNLRAVIEIALGKIAVDSITAAEMATLTSLNAINANISDLTGIEHATNLTVLNLQSNSLSDISPVAGLTNLTVLVLQSNSLSNISPIAGLTNLTSMDLRSNSLSDISPLARLTNLTVLLLSGNSISDISAMTGLTNLTRLRLKLNSISDLLPLVTNSGLSSGDEIDVRGNPLNYPSITTHIPTLQSRGVTVEFDTRTPTTLEIVSGNNQQGALGVALTNPFVVEVKDQHSEVFEGIPVTFTVTEGDGVLSSQTAQTDADGRAQTTLIFGSEQGLNTVSVNVEGISEPVIFNTGTEFDLPDPNLRAKIETALNKEPGDPITVVEMATLTRLNAESTNISDLTGLKFATNLTYLNLSNNNLTTLPAGVFEGLSKATVLNLRGNPLTTIKTGAFNGLSSLTELDLSPTGSSRGKLTTIEAGTFYGLASLQTLNLHNNNLTTLPTSVFEGLNTVTSLNLRGNPLTTIKAGAFNGFTRLQTLNLHNNNLTTLPTSVFEGLNTVTSLDLRGNLLTTIKRGAFNGLSSLAELDLSPTGSSRGKLTTIEAGAFKGLTSLQTLNLFYNNLTTLPTGVFEGLNKVTSLNLRYNPLKTIKAGAFNGLSSLTTLDLSSAYTNTRSDLTTIEVGAFNGLSSLTYLNLYYNNLTILPTGMFEGLNKVTSLALRGNPLKTIKAGAFNGLSSLTTLDLSSVDTNTRGDLTTIEAGAFTGLSSLTELNLYHNQIATLSIGLFEGLSNLTSLNLRGNLLTTIEAGALTGLSNLTELNLYHNQIATLPIGVFSGLNSLTSLNLNRNPGTPLTLTLELARTDTTDPTTPGPATVVVKLAQGAPFEMTVNLSIEGGTLSAPTATIARGETESAPITVVQDGVGSVITSLGDAPGIPSSYYGIRMAVSDTLVLFGPGSIPTQLVKISGDNQQGAAGTALASPLIVEVRDAENNAVQSIDVTFAVTAGDGTLSTTRTATDRNGRAETTLTLGPNLGTNTVSVSVDGIEQQVTFNALATPPETKVMVIEGTITNKDGTLAEAGLHITVTIGSNTQTGVSEGAGVYRVTLINPLEVLARSLDTVEVQVVRQATGESARQTVQLSSEQIIAQSATIDLEFSIAEYLLSVPVGISLIHVPMKVKSVDGVSKTIKSVGDLYDALGGAATVSLLITYDPNAQRWDSYLGARDKGKPADKALTDDLGIITSMKAPASIRLSGDALGTNGSSSITLHPGTNLVGVPLKDSRIARVSDLFSLEGIGDNVVVIIVSDNGEFKVVVRSGDAGDVEITGGQSFILTAREAATVIIEGDGWANAGQTTVAPPIVLTGIQANSATPVLAVTGSIVISGPVGGKSLSHPFRVTVKNLSTGKVDMVVTDDRGGYQLTFVDLETGRVAQIGDTLEITAQSLNPLVRVQPVRYVVTAEDVKRGHIQLGELVAYEIPAKTELLLNYPNPFNPETWIPYRLAEDANVALTIYDLSGGVVRRLDVGHRIAAVYESRSKAIYWDGRTEFGERVASGVYFYHLSAGDYSATRKMVILK